MHTYRLPCPRSCCGFPLAVGGLLLACWPSFDALDSGPAGSSSEGSSTDDAPPIDDPEPPQLDDASTDDANDGDADDGSDPTNFIERPDGGSPSYACDIWIQDCPDGEKCNVWANDGGSSWNARKCVPIDPDPDDAGEPCTVVESGVSGLDSCVIGSMCWDVDPETNTGTCVAFCVGSEANPTCADPSMHCVGREPMLCIPDCCPLEQDCSEGQGCYPTSETFSCVPDAGGEEGAFGDACEFINVCDPGLFCANPDAVPDCGGYGCCTSFCFVGSPQCAQMHPGMDCVPWFEDALAPPGFEHTGACFLEG